MERERRTHSLRSFQNFREKEMLKQAWKTLAESLGRREEATLEIGRCLYCPWNLFLHLHEDMFILSLLF